MVEIDEWKNMCQDGPFEKPSHDARLEGPDYVPSEIGQAASDDLFSDPVDGDEAPPPEARISTEDGDDADGGDEAAVNKEECSVKVRGSGGANLQEGTVPILFKTLDEVKAIDVGEDKNEAVVTFKSRGAVKPALSWFQNPESAYYRQSLSITPLKS